MGVSYGFTGFNPERLLATVEVYGDYLLDEAAGEMADIGSGAAERMQDMILRAVTPTGLARVANGDGIHAGRYDKGTFHDAVDWEIEIDAEARTIVVRWGWIDTWLEYFAYQEYGTEHIAAVSSLGESYTWGIAQLAGALRRAGAR